jgi:aconitate hydratase
MAGNMTDTAAFVRHDANGLRYVDIPELFAEHGHDARRMPRSIRILAEAAARGYVEGQMTAEELAAVCNWGPLAHLGEIELRFPVGRVILQDASGLPLLVDLAGLRDAVRRQGGDPAAVNPVVPIAMVIDHSVALDHHRGPEALAFNLRSELERNHERYRFARWAASAFDNVAIVPPGNGIVHQIHMERLVEVVSSRDGWCFSDLVIGTDSHTTMINGLGVLGWGVGGIEAAEAILGQPISMPAPEVVGVELHGMLAPGVGSSDAALTLTEWLRRKGVVGAILEFEGAGAAALAVADRATIANMAPEYGATAALFPLDRAVLGYLAQQGYCNADLARIRTHGVERTGNCDGVAYSRRMSFDLSTVKASVAGPSRPDQRVSLSSLARPKGVEVASSPSGLCSGDIVIAAITSCTNTANPHAMVAAGILARNALARGLSMPAHVRSSLAPGSRRVARYLHDLGLAEPLEALGFSIAAFGCATCVGNSGPLDVAIADEIAGKGLDVAAVLSGNRNFEARIHPLVKSNYLMSPALVVAFALKGNIHCDLHSEPIGTDRQGQPVRLAEIWPNDAEIVELVDKIPSGAPAIVVPEGWPEQAGGGLCWPWDPSSTHFIEPPFFAPSFSQPLCELVGARPLLVLGDNVTTDHISPVGLIGADTEAGRFLRAAGVPERDLGTFAGRRGNHAAMLRGTFANPRLHNRLCGEQTGPWTRELPGNALVPVHVAAESYRKAGTDMVIFAGRAYGMGSARDWAAKGTRLLGVRAVIARDFERIHRTNLVRAGVVPLRIDDDKFDPLQLDCTGDIAVSSFGLASLAHPTEQVRLIVTCGVKQAELDCIVDARSESEIELLHAGGFFSRIRERLVESICRARNGAMPTSPEDTASNGDDAGRRAGRP